jgi:hypothetical protein
VFSPRTSVEGRVERDGPQHHSATAGPVQRDRLQRRPLATAQTEPVRLGLIQLGWL